MAIRQIFKNDAECLYKKCRPVERFDKKLSDLIDDMADTMYKAEGVGHVAPRKRLINRARLYSAPYSRRNTATPPSR